MGRLFGLTLVGMFALHGGCLAQNLLAPCRYEGKDPYYQGVYRVIDKAVGKPSRLQLTVFPSFQAESGVRLLGTEVYHVQLLSSFWGDSQTWDRKGSGHMDFSKPKSLTRVRHAPLSSAVADRVEQVFAKATLAANGAELGGLDGTSYEFTMPGGGCGSTWSPDPKSPNGRLVRLMDRLEAHARFTVPIDLERSEKSLLRLLDQIEGR